MNRILGSLVVLVMLQACGDKAVEPAASILGLWSNPTGSSSPIETSVHDHPRPRVHVHYRYERHGFGSSMKTTLANGRLKQ